MFKRLDHIGMVVSSIQQVRQAYAALGLQITEMHDLPTKPVTVAVLPMGDLSLELLQPNAIGSNIADFLKEKGQGIHHICFEVENIETAIKSAREAGLELLDEIPREGVSGRIAFLSPSAMGGALIELLEKPK